MGLARSSGEGGFLEEGATCFFTKRGDRWLWCDPTSSHQTHIWRKRDPFVQSKNHTHKGVVSLHDEAS